MTTDATPAQESAGTTDDSETRITGPFAGYDQYGRLDHYYYRCARCGAESVRETDLEACCR